MSYVVTGLAVASLAVSAYGAYTQAQTQKKIAENNAEVAEINAADAKRRGELEAQKAHRQGQQLLGQQRASYAARGLDLGEGTVGDVIDQTDFFSQVDESTARNNAAKEAWAIKRGGMNQQMQADATNPGLALTGSLLSGAGSVASKWYSGTTPSTSGGSYSISGSAARG